jgi:hypothetical protein
MVLELGVFGSLPTTHILLFVVLFELFCTHTGDCGDHLFRAAIIPLETWFQCFSTSAAKSPRLSHEAFVCHFRFGSKKAWWMKKEGNSESLTDFYMQQPHNNTLAWAVFVKSA